MFARSTGRVYFVPGQDGVVGPLVRYDPARGGAPEKIAAELGVRAATAETPGGRIYTVSKGAKGEPSTPYLKFGDRLRIEMPDATGRSVFGAIEQRVVQYSPPR